MAKSVISSHRLSRFFPFGLIFILVTLLYIKTLPYQLTYFDDHAWLKDYHWYLKNFENSREFFHQQDLITGIFYRPVLNLSFMLDAQWSGQNPWGYRLTNLLIHLCNSVLVFLLFQKIGYQRNLSLFLSLFFALHPTLTSAVVWIPGRTDSLMAFFVLASFLAFLKSNERGSVGYWMLHLLLLAMGFFCKETAFILPVLCSGYFWLHRDASKKLMTQDAWLAVISWGVVMALLFSIRGTVLANSEKIPLTMMLSTIFENSPALISYLGKILFPVNLSVLPNQQDTTLLYGIVALVMIMALITVSRRKNWKRLIWAMGWYVCFLTPSLILSFIEHEYRLYLPMLGVLIVGAETDFIRNLTQHPRRFAIVGAIILTILFVLTFNNSRWYRDRHTFWHRAVETSPHAPLAHRNLGAMYYLENKLDLAEKYFRQSLALNPNEQMVHNNLGLILANQGRPREAEEEFKKEIEINPTYDNVYFNLGLLYFKYGRIAEAEKCWRKTIELNPRYITAYKNLVVLYFNTNNVRMATVYRDQLRQMGVSVDDLAFPTEKSVP